MPQKTSEVYTTPCPTPQRYSERFHQPTQLKRFSKSLRESLKPLEVCESGWGDIDFSVLIILTNLWKLLRLPEGPLYTTINILAIDLPSFFTSSVSSYMRLATVWSTLATHLPSLCLGSLFLPSDPWHSSYSPSHRLSTSITPRLTHAP